MSTHLPRVMVFGTFDLLHPGHLFVLREAEKRGSVTVVVARDHNVKHLKNITPAENEEARKRAIEELFPAFTVRLGDREDFLVPVKEAQPDLILLGYDQRLPHAITEADFPCAVERLPAFQPELHKSSLKRNMKG